MRYLLNRRLHVNMGPYEHIENVATVEVDTVQDAEVLANHGINPDEPEEVRAYVWSEINDFLAPGVEEAANYTDAEDSFVLPMYKDSQRGKRK